MIKKRDFDGLIQLLYHKKIPIRIEAVNALSELKDIESLVKALKNNNTQVCIQAISELEKFDEKHAIQAIIDIIVEKKDEDVWSSAFETTKRILSSKGLGKGEKVFWVQMALGAIKKNTIEHTLKILDRIIEINPDIEEYINNIGTLYNNNFNKEALNYIEKAFEIDPNNMILWICKGEILCQFKQWDESETCIKKALEIDPKSEGAYDTLMNIYFNSRQDEKFFSTVQKAFKYFPERMKFRYMLSDLLVINEELERAESEVQIALEIISKIDKIDPGQLSSFYEQLGIISVMKIHKDKALEYFLKAIEVNEKDPWVYKSFDAYIIMILINSAEKGTPLERRAELFNVASNRNADAAYRTYLDYMEGGLEKCRYD